MPIGLVHFRHCRVTEICLRSEFGIADALMYSGPVPGQILAAVPHTGFRPLKLCPARKLVSKRIQFPPVGSPNLGR